MIAYVLRCSDIKDHTLKYEAEDTDKPLKSKLYYDEIVILISTKDLYTDFLLGNLFQPF